MNTSATSAAPKTPETVALTWEGKPVSLVPIYDQLRQQREETAAALDEVKAERERLTAIHGALREKLATLERMISTGEVKRGERKGAARDVAFMPLPGTGGSEEGEQLCPITGLPERIFSGPQDDEEEAE